VTVPTAPNTSSARVQGCDLPANPARYCRFRSPRRSRHDPGFAQHRSTLLTWMDESAWLEVQIVSHLTRLLRGASGATGLSTSVFPCRGERGADPRRSV
jgi:hypothetical protein